MWWKHSVFLPAVGKQNITFSLDFIQPWKSLLEIPCTILGPKLLIPYSCVNKMWKNCILLHAADWRTQFFTSYSRNRWEVIFSAPVHISSPHPQECTFSWFISSLSSPPLMSPTNCSMHLENRLYPIFRLSMHLHPVQRRRRRDDGSPLPRSLLHCCNTLALSSDDCALKGGEHIRIALWWHNPTGVWWSVSAEHLIFPLLLRSDCSFRSYCFPSLTWKFFLLLIAPLICPSPLSGTLHLRSADLSQSECCCAFYRRPHILNWVFKKSLSMYRGPLFALSANSFWGTLVVIICEWSLWSCVQLLFNESRKMRKPLFKERSLYFAGKPNVWARSQPQEGELSRHLDRTGPPWEAYVWISVFRRDERMLNWRATHDATAGAGFETVKSICTSLWFY